MAKKQPSFKRGARHATGKPYQVFVSHATADKWLAVTICEKIEGTGAKSFRDDRDIKGGDDIPDEIRRQLKQSKEIVVILTPESIGRQEACRQAGFEAVTDGDLFALPNASDALWEALAESRAVLLILSPPGSDAWMHIEIGAARAWNKPVYAIVTDPSSVRPSAAMSGIGLYTVARLQEVIRAIQSSVHRFTDHELDLLTKLYAKMEISVDELALDMDQREELVRRFKRGTGKAVPGEHLLSELLRLRKQGKLVRKRPARGVRPKSKPA
jgi:hypothetical protein